MTLKRRIPITITLAAIILAATAALVGMHSASASLARMAAAYLLVMLLPGAAFACAITRRPTFLNLILHSLLTSPVLTTAMAAVMLLAGAGTEMTATTILFTSALFSAAVLFARRDHGITLEISGKRILILLGIAAFFCAVAGYLPLSSEWWRMRSDAWFHAAVVAEIDTYGLPPQDPYFSGLPLQYMWFYHVLVLLLARATSIEPFMVMPIINIQALAAFVVATFLFSLRLTGSKQRFGYAVSAVLVAVLGMNALFWIFLPVKLARAFIGESTGLNVAASIMSLSPFDISTVREFLRIYYNQVFFLDKFIVSTAFSLGIAYMAAFWYAVTDYLGDGKPRTLWLVLFSTIGMLAFHSEVGFVMCVGLAGGLASLWTVRRGLTGYSFKRSCLLALTVLAGFIITAPYLYSIMHAKEAENAIPFGLSAAKFIGFFISCALAILLALFQVKRLMHARSAQEIYVLFAALAVTVFSLVIVLPASNTFDKLPFFIYYPLAVLGGRTLIDWAGRTGVSGARRTVATVLLFALILLPANLIATLGYYNTSTPAIVSPMEEKISAWVAENTARDAIFIDSNDRVFLLVTGPRRYYWGIIAYSEQWGYDFDEMKKRKHVRDNLFGKGPIDKETLDAIASLKQDLYIVVREPDGSDVPQGRGFSGQPEGMEKFDSYPILFAAVHRADHITLLRVNKEECRTWSELLPE